MILLVLASCTELDTPNNRNKNTHVQENRAISVTLEDNYKLEIFELDAAKGGEIVGGLGTRLTFPPFAFEDINGFVIDGKVRLELKEFYVDAEETHQLFLKEDNQVLHDYAFELRGYEGKLPLVFVSNLDVAALMD